MKGTFPQSKELKEIIESYNWTLYDVIQPSERIHPIWEELDKTSPANQYEIGHNYLFVPIPKAGQTLRQTYAPTKGLGPSLTIDNPDDSRWGALEFQKKQNRNVALFSRLFMEEKFAVVSSPRMTYLPNPDLVAIKWDKFVDTFKQYFRIVSPEEYGMTTPIPVPIDMN